MPHAYIPESASMVIRVRSRTLPSRVTLYVHYAAGRLRWVLAIKNEERVSKWSTQDPAKAAKWAAEMRDESANVAEVETMFESPVLIEQALRGARAAA